MDIEPLTEIELQQLEQAAREAAERPPAVGKIRPAWAWDDEAYGRIVLADPVTILRLVAMIRRG